jgi:hypothetical protein
VATRAIPVVTFGLTATLEAIKWNR